MTTIDDVIINAPTKNETNENLYIFNVSKGDGETLGFQSKENYNVNCREEEQMLTIPTKSDLRELSEFFHKIKASFLENHEEWFEEKFTPSVLDDLFKNFLQPNVVENCIDLKVSVPTSTLEKMKRLLKENESGFYTVIPYFLFESIVLEVNSNKMYCIVVLNDFNLPDEISNKTDDIPEKELVVEEAPVEEAPVEDVNLEEKNVKEEPVVDIPIDNDELVELDFDTTNLTDSKIKMNVQDYLIIYKYILGQIKENKIKEIEKICVSKGIDMEVLDCEEIFNDSDDEYFSSSESEHSNDESSFN